MILREKSKAYLALSASQVSVNKTSSVEGFGAAFTVAYSSFFTELIAFTTMKITKAIIAKSTTV